MQLQHTVYQSFFVYLFPESKLLLSKCQLIFITVVMHFHRSCWPSAAKVPLRQKELEDNRGLCSSNRCTLLSGWDGKWAFNLWKLTQTATIESYSLPFFCLRHAFSCSVCFFPSHLWHAHTHTHHFPWFIPEGTVPVLSKCISFIRSQGLTIKELQSSTKGISVMAFIKTRLGDTHTSTEIQNNISTQIWR